MLSFNVYNILLKVNVYESRNYIKLEKLKISKTI